MPALLPPLKKQQAIATYLYVKHNAIDFAITRKHNTIEKLAEYKKPVIYEAVTGKKEVQTLDKPYLTREEQYRKILNNEEINRIEDWELRSIRSKYWNLRHEVFVDEANIPDTKVEQIWEELCVQEQKEIEAYRQRKGELP